ncbi:MAG: ATP-binding protein [Clostridiales Family XIII bacterium]|jgi:AAA+ superfamily predicted ATPase|nr:ATP-binding protein [Clostridiales Family XIII bacterium]
MPTNRLFPKALKDAPFSGHAEYAAYLFACVDARIDAYISSMKPLFMSGEGGYKNVLYPDIETAHDLCKKQLSDFAEGASHESGGGERAADPAAADMPSELSELFADFSVADLTDARPSAFDASAGELLAYVESRARATDLARVPLPIYSLSRKLELAPFSLFCFAGALLASTQTNYAVIFQIVNQNAALTAPSFESAARVYHGAAFSITAASEDMSRALEQLTPVLEMNINRNMPFSTILSPDKRMIDFLFGSEPLRVDERFSRFFTTLTSDEDLTPLLANEGELDALRIAYADGTRVFSLFGDEGSGRRFTIKHFCAAQGINCIAADCGKLFVYDFNFVEKALWALARECTLTGACCCLTNLGYREEEKEKFFGYMDLAFGVLTRREITVFTSGTDKLPLKEITRLDYAQFELQTPSGREREALWRRYAEPYAFEEDVDMIEMAAKFLFTPGKIKNALKTGRSLSAMKKLDKTSRACLFEACYNQMSHELTQKATKIKATYTWDDIVMSRDQRQSLEYACDQIRYRKQVYEEWDYNRKYPYGRGLSVLLFGAPGTGKSMCAQVLANALNLELYRVDLSKVVDKYVGETEKSISMIFREAKKCNVVLFFDECDTLFAKRADDGGANQSSNNNKTALLLQEVEAYDGVSVLATNYKHNIDPAFFRRMKFIVEFQFPDPETRYILWTTTIPKNTPLADDVDIRFLADRFEFVGGNIKNCILNAAFLAAGDAEAGGMVHMRHYLLAIRYEFVKTGKVFTRSDFEPYANQIL